MEQGSQEWLKWRAKGIGSSDIGTIMGVNPYKTPYQLWSEKCEITQEIDISKNYFVKRGNTLEPYARDLFNETFSSKFIPDVFIDEKFEFMRYSSDGFDMEKNEIIEIKCMGDKNHTKFCDSLEVPGQYLYQCLWALMISKAVKLHFVAYNPSFPFPITTISIFPDENKNILMQTKASEFWNCVISKKWEFEKNENTRGPN